MTEVLPNATPGTGMPTCRDRLAPAPGDSAEGRAGPESIPEATVAQGPVLITAQEVLLGTAAAVTVPSKKTSEQWIALLRQRRLFMRSRADERAAKRKHYPRHYAFVEQALMAREMERC